jgi:hypothetical protein
LESVDFENAVRLAISIGGDSDTIACITGGIRLLDCFTLRVRNDGAYGDSPRP